MKGRTRRIGKIRFLRTIEVRIDPHKLRRAGKIGKIRLVR